MVWGWEEEEVVILLGGRGEGVGVWGIDERKN